MASLLVSSCSDDRGEQKKTGDSTADAAASARQPAVTAPTVDEIKGLLPESVVGCPWVETQDISIADTAREGAEERAVFEATVRLKEDLCAPAETPAQLNALRQKVNPLLDRAMTPESQYLLQIGADPSAITEDDQKAKPLPAELGEKADALRRLAEPAVFQVAVHAGETLALRGTVKRAATPGGEAAPWELEAIDTAPLDAWKKQTPLSALPEESSVLSAAWLTEQTQRLESAMAEFEKAAAPYIEGRENAARTRLLEARAREEARKAKAEAAAESLRNERARFEQASAAGKTWQGEWSLGEQGGKLAMTIVTSDVGDRSALLTANLTDPDLPQAAVDLKGRCLLVPEEGEQYRFQIAIADGLYDPDAATAKIYDASDGVLLLNLTDDGSLEGVLTCKSWTKEQEGQVVKVFLKPSTKSKRDAR